ncbi:hypothetical protein EV356DRAFT_500430 [Viridothelium virens]|uniref:Uncharacterized protein n=1 Tax=Viridothelium virens TaxID=1048519 RepID=A0A6A6HBU3_VIRVR|nr:hypothetical protein EV356DRAFT_500430 [Viridothelium virens]
MCTYDTFYFPRCGHTTVRLALPCHFRRNSQTHACDRVCVFRMAINVPAPAVCENCATRGGGGGGGLHYSPRTFSQRVHELQG